MNNTATSTWKANYPYEIRRMERWNFDRAEPDVWYELWENYTNWRGKLKRRRVVVGFYMDSKMYAQGDLDWAQKTAKRFNLKVPK